MTDSDDVLRNAHLPMNPATQEKAAQFAIDCGAADLLAVMGLTVADRAVNAVRWVAHVEAGPSVPNSAPTCCRAYCGEPAYCDEFGGCLGDETDADS